MLQSMNVMVYVDDVEKVAAFFERVAGTPRTEEKTMIDGSKTVTVPVLPEVSLQFYSRAFIQKYSPEVMLNSPSLMFYVDDLASAHARLLQMGATVNEIVLVGDQQTFNFADPEGNWYAVAEKNV
ncbi:VOC family protein [Limosilactobacillus mucosae]|uniref:VOC family protein n=1 Tax=Limosilactobacillus mucosae TaxID=97478 RepID=UPI00399242E5